MEHINNYLAVIGDLVDSKKIAERKSVQNKLESAIENVNRKYSQCIMSKFLITLGDEFQGLLKPTDQIFDIITDIVEVLEPVQIRFGVGYGSITTNLHNVALGMDGPAFYLAREAIEEAHRFKGHMIVFRNQSPNDSNLAVPTVLMLLSQIRNLWSPKHKLIHAYTRAGMSQIQIAAKLKITQSAVSQAIDKARIAEIKEAENNLKQLLNDLFRFQSSTNNR